MTLPCHRRSELSYEVLHKGPSWRHSLFPGVHVGWESESSSHPRAAEQPCCASVFPCESGEAGCMGIDKLDRLPQHCVWAVRSTSPQAGVLAYSYTSFLVVPSVTFLSSLLFYKILEVLLGRRLQSRTLFTGFGLQDPLERSGSGWRLQVHALKPVSHFPCFLILQDPLELIIFIFWVFCLFCFPNKKP